jgi:hypothetical protein
MSNLEQKLSELQYNFNDQFDLDVLHQITGKVLALPNYKWMVGSIAASIILCLGILYFQDGAINYDTLLGVDILNTDSTTDIFNYL